MMGCEIQNRVGMDFYLNSIQELHCASVMIPLGVIRPSEYDGFSSEEEENFRLFGCELLQEGGIMLKLPQATMVTAMELFHRFAFRSSFMNVDYQAVVSACLFLATKLEETPKKMKDVISVLDYLIKIKEGRDNPITVLDLSSKEYVKYRADLILAETLLLKQVGFILSHIQKKPYLYLFYYLKLLKLDSTFAQSAWNYINDFFRTSACVSFLPHEIACGAIYLTSRTLNSPLPDLEWWKAFNCTIEKIEEICAELLCLFERKKIKIEYIYDTLAKRTLVSKPIVSEDFIANRDISTKQQESPSNVEERKSQVSERKSSKSHHSNHSKHRHSYRNRSRSQSHERGHRGNYHRSHGHRHPSSHKKSRKNVHNNNRQAKESSNDSLYE